MTNKVALTRHIPCNLHLKQMCTAEHNDEINVMKRDQNTLKNKPYYVTTKKILAEGCNFLSSSRAYEVLFD